jgi:hypothetical protein
MTTNAPTSALVTGWDRLAVIVLGTAGCALSASALMQMATAIHIRPHLAYLFPLAIDGFIAYGIRALLVLRTAPLRARLYVWTLVGSATGVSVWANALHAVRLNQTASATGGLQLGDTVVAALSTVAPLALAGAVHLYILIARGPDNHADRPEVSTATATAAVGQVGYRDQAGAVTRAARYGHGQTGRVGHGDRSAGSAVTGPDRVGGRSPGAGQSGAGQSGAGQPVTPPTGQPRATASPQTSVTGSPAGTGHPADGHRPHASQTAGLVGHPDSAHAVSDRTVPAGRVTAGQVSRLQVADRPVTREPVSGGGPRRAGVRRSDPDTETLLAIARSAVKAQDKLTRKVVAEAIRGQQIPLSSDTLTALMADLRAQRDTPVTASRD